MQNANDSRRWRASRDLACALACALVSGCTAPPPAGSPHPRPGATPAKRAPPESSAARARPPEPELPPLLPAPTLAPTRAFERIALPGGVELEDFAGHGDRAWLLADDTVYEHDGEKVVHIVKLCPVSRGRWHRYSLAPTPAGVVAIAWWDAPEHVVAYLHAGGRVVCRRYPKTELSDLLFVLTVLASTRGVKLPHDTLKILGARVAPPREDHPPYASFFAPRRDSLWLQVADGDERPTFHFDGTAWRRAIPAPPLSRIGSMWSAPDRNIWVIKNYGPVLSGDTGAGSRNHELAIYDGARWKVLPVPQGFLVRHVVGTSDTDVWFVGSTNVIQWDGATWRGQTFVPLAPSDP